MNRNCVVPLLILQGHIAGEDVAVLEPLGHVGVPGAVIEDETTNELSVHLGLVLHLHDLHHVQVNSLALFFDSQYGINTGLSEEISKLLVHLGSQRGPCNMEKSLPLRLNLDFDFLKHLKGLGFGEIKAFGQDPGVEALRDVKIGLLQQLSN